MDADLSAATLVYNHLDYLDRLVTDADLRSKAALAETELTRLSAAWRELLTTHQPDRHGRCPQCSRWRRPRRHPCSVWTIAHQHLVATDGPSPAQTGGHAAARGQPSRCWGPPDRGRAVAPDVPVPGPPGT